jgi:hypothetical protein
MSTFLIRATAILIVSVFAGCHEAAPVEDPEGNSQLYGIAANWQFGDSMIVELLIWPPSGVLTSHVLSSGEVNSDGSFFLALPPPPLNTLDSEVGAYTGLSGQPGIPFNVSYKLRVRAKPSGYTYGWLVQSSQYHTNPPNTTEFIANLVYVDRAVTLADTIGGWWQGGRPDADFSIILRSNLGGWAYSETTWTYRSMSLEAGWNCVVHRFLGGAGRTSTFSMHAENHPVTVWRFYDISAMSALPWIWRRLP